LAGPSANSKSDLARFRLASRTTCEGANPYFFEHLDITPPFRRRVLTAEWRQKLLAFGQRPWTKHVQSLEIGFSNPWHDQGLRGDELQELLAAGAYAIPSFVRACGGLSAVKICVRSQDLASDCRGNRNWSRLILLSMIENVLHECTPLLRSLEIRLPLTRDFEALNQYVTKAPVLLDIISRLEDLDIAINDASGPGSFRYFHSPESDDHRDFPNRHHEDGFWRFVQLTTALKTLFVSGTHVLNLDMLPDVCTGTLQELYLTGVEVSCSKLDGLVRTNLTKLKSVQLWCVKLTSGRWADVLAKFCELQNLILFGIDSCGYSILGSASHRAQRLLPEPDNPQQIETVFWEEDYSALGALQRHVNGLRAAAHLQLYSDSDYRYMDRT
jgi:hypothetical protein